MSTFLWSDMAIICPGGGIGRRIGLKIQECKTLCGFKSRPGHQLNKLNMILFVRYSKFNFHIVDYINAISDKYNSARLVELADTLDLGSSALRRKSSSLLSRTIFILRRRYSSVMCFVVIFLLSILIYSSVISHNELATLIAMIGLILVEYANDIERRQNEQINKIKGLHYKVNKLLKHNGEEISDYNDYF